MKNRKNVIMGILLALIVVMGVVYAAFAAKLNINGTGMITSNWKIEITDIKKGSVVGDAKEAVAPTTDKNKLTANFSLNFSAPGDSITYLVTVKNTGTIDAILRDTTIRKTGTNVFIYTITGLKNGDKLASGASKVVSVKIEYDINTTSAPYVTEGGLNIGFDFIQNLGQTITNEEIVIDDTYQINIPKDNCFVFDQRNGRIDGYYNNEGNDTNNPACPKSIAIPSKIGRVEVTAIAFAAFNQKGLTTVIIPPTVTTIGLNAFFWNELIEVEIPSSVETIGAGAFAGNKLTEIEIPSGVTTIDDAAFSGNKLAKIEIPSSVTTIGAGAFIRNRLTSVIIKGKNSASDFLTYGTDVWGWAEGYSDSNIVWNG